MDEYRPLIEIAVMFLPLLCAWMLKNHFVTLDKADEAEIQRLRAMSDDSLDMAILRKECLGESMAALWAERERRCDPP